MMMIRYWEPELIIIWGYDDDDTSYSRDKWRISTGDVTNAGRDGRTRKDRTVGRLSFAISGQIQGKGYSQIVLKCCKMMLPNDVANCKRCNLANATKCCCHQRLHWIWWSCLLRWSELQCDGEWFALQKYSGAINCNVGIAAHFILYSCSVVMRCCSGDLVHTVNYVIWPYNLLPTAQVGHQF